MEQAQPLGGARRRTLLALSAGVISGLLTAHAAESKVDPAVFAYEYLFLQFKKGLGHVAAFVAYLEDGLGPIHIQDSQA